MKKISIKILKVMILLVMGVCLFSIASKVSAFTISPNNPTVKEEEELEFKVYDENGKDITKKIRWSSENSSIANIGYSTGKLTAKKAGTVKIEAKHYDTKEVVEFTVTVKGDNKITLNKTYIEMEEDGEEKLFAVNSKGKEISKYEIEWISSNEKVVKVKEGKIDPVGFGEAIITAKHKETGATATCTVKVKDKITLNTTSITMNVGEKETLIAYNKKGKEISNTYIEWTSSNEKIAKVRRGEIEARKKGSVTITAVYKETGAKATCTVIVNENSQSSSTTTSTVVTTPTTPAAPAKPATTTTATTTTTTTPSTQVGEADITIPEESIIPTDTVKTEEEIENENGIEEVTSNAINGGFSINGLLSWITGFINKILDFIVNDVINGGLNKLF